MHEVGDKEENDVSEAYYYESDTSDNELSSMEYLGKVSFEKKKV